MSLITEHPSTAQAATMLRKLDPRTTEQVYHQALSLAKIYCPEWLNIQQSEVDEQDLGVVLLKLFAQLCDTVSQRINQIPQKQLLSFYQFLGLEMRQPKPARVLLSFILDASVQKPVQIAKGVQVASGKDQKIIYETTEALRASNLCLVAAYAVDPATDTAVDLSEIVLAKKKIFTILGSNTLCIDDRKPPCSVPFKHIMALSSPYFDYQTPATLTLVIQFDQIFHGQNETEVRENKHKKAAEIFKWFAFDSKGKQVSLVPELKWQGDELALTFNDIILYPGNVGGIKRNWLGCSLDAEALEKAKIFQPIANKDDIVYGPLGQQAPMIGKIRKINFTLEAKNIPWDALFVNDGKVSAKKGFYIFGKTPALNDTFYFASSEAFKPGFNVTLTMKINPGVKSKALQLAWQFFDGQQWQDFSEYFNVQYRDLHNPNKNWLDLPKDTHFNFDLSGVEEAEIKNKFTCPNINTAKINGIVSRWIRVRIIKGDYGDRYTLTPLDLEQQQEFEKAQQNELVPLATQWQDKVIPDKSVFETMALMELARLRVNKIKIRNPWPIKDEIIQPKPIFMPQVMIEPREKVLKYSGLDKKILDKNMLKYLGDAPIGKNILTYLSAQKWVIGSIKNCVAPYMISLTLAYEKNGAKITHRYSENNFAKQEEIQEEMQDFQLPFFPFYGIIGEPSFFLGFQGGGRQLRWNGYFSFSIPNPSKLSVNHQDYDIAYEYYCKDGYWKQLAREVDQTNNLGRSGMISWLIPEKDLPIKQEASTTKKIALFSRSESICWVRLRRQPRSISATEVAAAAYAAVATTLLDSINKKSDATPSTKREAGIQIKGIYPNSVWAEDYTTHTNQVLGTSNQTANQKFRISPNLVYPGQKIEVREMTLPVPEQLRMIELEAGKGAIRQQLNKDLKEIWVRWSEVPSLQLSGQKSRHYTINRNIGTITFGDGVRGMVPPALKNNIVASFYQCGNRAVHMPVAGDLNKLLRSLPDISAVINHEDAIGKLREEQTSEFLVRAPHTIKTRDRAVTLSDFQFLAMQSSNLVSQAKCFQEEQTPHLIEVIIAPSSHYGSYYPGADLSQTVCEYLYQRALPTLKKQIHISAPDYAEIDVTAELSICSGHTQATVKAAVKKALSHFLNPVDGQKNQQGWDFGAVIFVSQISGVIGNVAGVVKTINVRINDKTKTDNTLQTASRSLTQVRLGEKSLPLPGTIDISFGEIDGQGKL